MFNDSINYETFLKIKRLMDSNFWLGENNSILVSGFRMQRGKIFVLQHCKSHTNLLTGYSRALGVDVSIEKQQARPLLYDKTVHGYIIIESQKDCNYLILNDKDTSQSLSDNLLSNYLNECDAIDQEGKKSFFFSLLTSKRRWVVDTPKFIISTSNQLCKCVYDKDKHWTFPLGMYAMPADTLPTCLSRQITLAIYNSKLFSFYKMEYEKAYRKEKCVHFAAIKSFPIPYYISNEFQFVLDNLVDTIVAYKEKNSIVDSSKEDRKAYYLQELIDMCIYELYFTGHMQKNNLVVVHKLMKAPFMDKVLNMEDKVAETYSWLMKSDNVVRQRIMLLDTRSPLILGRIHNFHFK